MDQLKPCPFCGGEAKIKSSSAFGLIPCVYVQCQKCGVRTGNWTSKSQNKANAFWNRRTEVASRD